jgi:hypothetical protein
MSITVLLRLEALEKEVSELRRRLEAAADKAVGGPVGSEVAVPMPRPAVPGAKPARDRRSRKA